MNRFSKNKLGDIAASAIEADAQTTAERTANEGGAPPISSSAPTVNGKPARKKTTPKPAAKSLELQDDAGMSFPVRMYFTFNENDPVGRVLAERVRELPEASRADYATANVVRKAVKDSLDYLAKKM